jgi:hypothetical protein
MIAHRYGLPLLKLEDGTLATIERDWLRSSIVTAAHRAGYGKWWLADHIGASVIEYFSRRVEENVIPLDRIVGAVREVLQAVGYEDVAGHYAPSIPPLKICLRTLAEAAGTGGELHFYNLLDRELANALATPTRSICLEGLREAVKLLKSAKNWRRSCDELSSEIVNYTNERFRHHASIAEVALQIC